MAVTAHATDVPVQQPLTQHPVVSPPPLEACLLLAQAVAQLGTSSWDQVAQKLDGCESWPDEAGKMTSQGYETAFAEIMQQRGLDPSACSKPFSRPSRKLVHALYSTLLTSLHSSILSSFAEEARLKDEIARLASGALDATLSPPLSASAPAASSSTSTLAAPPASPEKRPRTPSGRKSGRKAAAEEADDGDVEMQDAAAGADKAGPSEDEGGEAEEEAEEEEEASPKKGRRKGARGRSAQKKKQRGATAEVEGDDEEKVAEGNEDEQDKAVKEEEEDDAPVGADEGEGEGEDGEEDGDDDEEGEEETPKPRSGRARSGRKNRTAAATAAKKAANKRKASEPPAESPQPADTAADARKRKRVKTTEEPAEDEKDNKATVQRRKAAYTRIIEQLQTERYSHFFESRVTRTIAPLYGVAVRRSTCLKDVLKAIKSGNISSSTELMRDVALLCANAMQFNGDEGEDSVGHCAKLMWERFERLMDEALSAELSVE
ncbi:hypothetical protein Rhopal_005877-T1 [Rhodotorula paludigena]|uniref:Bromo domain-containing protein n=1 Tax=Rhodotorula paludigena TaxID=86838 RepID=A0AAV5GUD6_9BASI|nr:hypothetical protein Rhopal_005877-T1 [Rhodotorula paludigena]